MLNEYWIIGFTRYKAIFRNVIFILVYLFILFLPDGLKMHLNSTRTFQQHILPHCLTSSSFIFFLLPYHPQLINNLVFKSGVQISSTVRFTLFSILHLSIQCSTRSSFTLNKSTFLYSYPNQELLISVKSCI